MTETHQKQYFGYVIRDATTTCGRFHPEIPAVLRCVPNVAIMQQKRNKPGNYMQPIRPPLRE
jgi:hypothetical protein